MLTQRLLAFFPFLALMGTGCSGGSQALDPAVAQAPDGSPVTFYGVSSLRGLVSPPNWKYHGPSVSDLNNDGRYDLVLCNHDQTPVEIFMATGTHDFERLPKVIFREDYHGLSSGDYDNDGDLDVMFSIGGGNGTNPKPPRLLRNDDGVFTDVTVASGISEMGGRGRCVRWIDLDTDGDLDFIQVNAKMPGDFKGPRNIIFENLGDGTFVYKPSKVFEDIDGDRVLVTDFNQDHVPDLIVFTGHRTSFWRGNNDFTFTDVSAEVLPDSVQGVTSVKAIAEADIDQDGDLDYYLARGAKGGGLGGSSVSFDACCEQVDIRDNGKTPGGSVMLTAPDSVDLINLYHFPRPAQPGPIPVYLGAEKTQIPTPTGLIKYINHKDAMGFPEGELTEPGWYLGYLGEDQWRLQWVLKGNETWFLRGTVLNVKAVTPTEPVEPIDMPDVLLRNDGGTFTDISDRLPGVVSSGNTGVATADFNNDGHQDFFVYRFGKTRTRINDLLLINEGMGEAFSVHTDHGATELNQLSHGDMGAAFDYDLDGDVDILSGDDDDGSWNLFQNMTVDNTSPASSNQHLLVRVGYAESGVDPIGAWIEVTTDLGTQVRRVGSGSAALSQSLLNTAHFGLGEASAVKRVYVRWRDGSEAELAGVSLNDLVMLGSVKPAG